tara:strand:- start:1217 stop:2437 length:1221 start_codon:yes stop_codon:yes gene_type:complete
MKYFYKLLENICLIATNKQSIPFKLLRSEAFKASQEGIEELKQIKHVIELLTLTNLDDLDKLKTMEAAIKAHIQLSRNNLKKYYDQLRKDTEIIKKKYREIPIELMKRPHLLPDLTEIIKEKYREIPIKLMKRPHLLPDLNNSSLHVKDTKKLSVNKLCDNHLESSATMKKIVGNIRDLQKLTKESEEPKDLYIEVCRSAQDGLLIASNKKGSQFDDIRDSILKVTDMAIERSKEKWPRFIYELCYLENRDTDRIKRLVSKLEGKTKNGCEDVSVIYKRLKENQRTYDVHESVTPETAEQWLRKDLSENLDKFTPDTLVGIIDKLAEFSKDTQETVLEVAALNYRILNSDPYNCIKQALMNKAKESSLTVEQRERIKAICDYNDISQVSLSDELEFFNKLSHCRIR